MLIDLASEITMFIDFVIPTPRDILTVFGMIYSRLMDNALYFLSRNMVFEMANHVRLLYLSVLTVRDIQDFTAIINGQEMVVIRTDMLEAVAPYVRTATRILMMFYLAYFILNELVYLPTGSAAPQVNKKG